MRARVRGIVRTMRTPVVLLTLLLTLALPLAACGGGGSSKEATPKDQVTADWRKAADAVVAGDAEALCVRVADDAKAVIKKETGLECADAIKVVFARTQKADRESLKGVKITAVTVNPDGKTANVKYTVTSALKALGFDGSSDMIKTGDGWLLQGG
ncbi:unannotated protein [freshwater metagenome]|uniref:Unannotated protein n=1 Tax=freshwater metagenome TaxID=449393 RepID=A0A6J7JL66_9ZZZZ